MTTLCKCGHVEGTHKRGKKCLALKSLRGQSALICDCKSFTPVKEKELDEAERVYLAEYGIDMTFHKRREYHTRRTEDGCVRYILPRRTHKEGLEDLK